MADDELTRELLDLIQSSRDTAPDDERGWLRRANRAERRVVGDFGDLETDLRGPSETGTAIDREGQPFWWPEADRALFQSLRNWISPHVKLIELDLHINDPTFAEACARTLLDMLA